MKIMDAFPSKYLRASDLNGRQWELVMNRVEMESMGEGEAKPVLYFMGAEKGLVLNKVNSEMIILMYGEETDHWQGQKVLLKPDKTQFGGRIVDCIRVVWTQRTAVGGVAPTPAPAPLGNGTPPAPPVQQFPPVGAAQGGGPSSDDPLNDAIPFIAPFDISRKRGFRT